MTSYLKKQYDEYRDRNRSVPTFQSFVNHPSKDISKPMENSFIHINGTSPHIVDRSKTIIKQHSTNQHLEEDTDCIIVNNSRFYSTVKEEGKATLEKRSANNETENEEPDGIEREINPYTLRSELSFRDTTLRTPVRGSSLDTEEDLSLDLDSPEVEFNQCTLTLQKSVVEKYKLGDLVEEMDDKFFDMTMEEKTYHIEHHSKDQLINSPATADKVEIVVKTHRTPPPPPRPVRKNSQKRIEETIGKNDTNDEFE